MKIETRSGNLPYLMGLCSYHGYFRNYNDEDRIDEDEVITSEYVYANALPGSASAEYITKELPGLMEHYLEPLNDYFGPGFVSYLGSDGHDFPREYNFRGDSYNLDFAVGDNFISTVYRALLTDGLPSDDYGLIGMAPFRDYLREKYSSRDGFMSFRPSTIVGWKNLIKDEPNQAREMLLSYLISELCDEEDINDYIIENMWQSGNGCGYSYREFTDWSALEETHHILDGAMAEAAWEVDLFSDYSEDEAERILRYYWGNNRGESELDMTMYSEDNYEMATAKLFGAKWHQVTYEDAESLAKLWLSDRFGMPVDDVELETSMSVFEAVVRIAKDDVVSFVDPNQLRLKL